jgi:hypothetical protein
MPRSISTRNFSLWLDDELGITRGRMTEGMGEDGEHALENLAAIRTLVEGKPRPFLVDVRGGTRFTREARELYASDAPRGAWVAVAILVDSMVTRAIANFFLAVNHPRWPFRMFTDEAEAIRWLQQHRP